MKNKHSSIFGFTLLCFFTLGLSTAAIAQDENHNSSYDPEGKLKELGIVLPPE